jgi:hypothetical protein
MKYHPLTNQQLKTRSYLIFPTCFLPTRAEISTLPFYITIQLAVTSSKRFTNQLEATVHNAQSIFQEPFGEKSAYYIRSNTESPTLMWGPSTCTLFLTVFTHASQPRTHGVPLSRAKPAQRVLSAGILGVRRVLVLQNAWHFFKRSWDFPSLLLSGQHPRSQRTLTRTEFTRHFPADLSRPMDPDHINQRDEEFALLTYVRHAALVLPEVPGANLGPDRERLS